MSATNPYTKAYSRKYWQNSPSTDTPLNKTNLDNNEAGTDILDNRIIALDTNKLDITSAANMFVDVSLDETTGVFTFTKNNGTTKTLQTVINKVVNNYSFNSSTQKLELTLEDGTVQEIDLSAFITEWDFQDSDTIGWTVVNHVAVASVINHSIGSDQLETDYLADCLVAKNSAETAAQSASSSADNAEAESLNAEGWAVGEQNGVPVGSTSPYYHNNAKYYKDQAQSIVGVPSLSSLSDVSLVSPQDGQSLKYDGTNNEWINADSLSVVDSLTSTSSTDALSAKQGKVINDSLTAEIAKKGQPNGYASLDSDGRIPYSQLPESAMEYKGTWNASTNTPTLAQGVGTNGDFYIVSVGGTWNNIVFYVNDRIIYDGITETWQKISGNGEVTVVKDILGLVNLPNDYRQVEYLESHGTEYIDTGYIFNLNTDEITVDVQFVDNAEYRTPISVNNVLQVYPSLGWYTAYICNGSTWETGTFGVLDNNKHHIVFNSTGAYIDGTTVLTPTGIIAESANLRLFITQSSVAGLFKIYDVKVKHNNVLVRHFVPCFRQSDSILGMYDVVNNVFYDNDGTGTFGYNELLTLPEITDRMHGPLDVADGGTGKTSLASTKYTTLEYRGESLNSSDTTPTLNGTIAWKYE